MNNDQRVAAQRAAAVTPEMRKAALDETHRRVARKHRMSMLKEWDAYTVRNCLVQNPTVQAFPDGVEVRYTDNDGVGHRCFIKS